MSIGIFSLERIIFWLANEITSVSGDERVQRVYLDYIKDAVDHLLDHWDEEEHGVYLNQTPS